MTERERLEQYVFEYSVDDMGIRLFHTDEEIWESIHQMADDELRNYIVNREENS